MDTQAADLARFPESHELEVLARVGRLEDAAADNYIRANRGAAGAYPHVIGV